jgi:23S rRNA (uracil1939-C5)-methyltransferase
VSVVRALDAHGEGEIVLPDGTIALARGVLPGERVRVGSIERGRVKRARGVEVVEASPDRVAPPCPHAATCGGCPLMHASASAQAAIKRERVRRALPGVEIEIVAPDDALAYRQRARLAFDGARIGYRGDASRSLVEIDRCLVLSPVLAATLDVVQRRIAPVLAGSGELRLGACGDRGTIRVEARDAQSPALYAELDACVRDGSIAGVALFAAGAGAARFGVDHEETIDLDGRTLRAPLGGFTQAHASHNRALAAHAIDRAEAGGARVLELFAGHGNFTLALAARAASVHAVELDADATRCLIQNLSAHHLRAEVATSDAARATAAMARSSIDVVLLDPPREGARDAIAPLTALAPARIVYVSCDPESLARDAARLADRGYVLRDARAFDMFPQTAHVEVVARFDRGSSVAAPRRRR